MAARCCGGLVRRVAWRHRDRGTVRVRQIRDRILHRQTGSGIDLWRGGVDRRGFDRGLLLGANRAAGRGDHPRFCNAPGFDQKAKRRSFGGELMAAGQAGGVATFRSPSEELCEASKIIPSNFSQEVGHERSHLPSRTCGGNLGGLVLLRPSLKGAEMSLENIGVAPRGDVAPRFLQWSPIVLGALAATALSFILV